MLRLQPERSPQSMEDECETGSRESSRTLRRSNVKPGGQWTAMSKRGGSDRASSFDADLGKRQHGGSGGGPAHEGGGAEGGEDQNVLHLRRKVLRLLGIGKNTIILHPPIGVHISFDDERIVFDLAKRVSERRLFKLWRRVNHDGHVRTGLQWQSEKAHEHRKHGNCTD